MNSQDIKTQITPVNFWKLASSKRTRFFFGIGIFNYTMSVVFIVAAWMADCPENLLLAGISLANVLIGLLVFISAVYFHRIENIERLCNEAANYIDSYVSQRASELG